VARTLPASARESADRGSLREDAIRRALDELPRHQTQILALRFGARFGHMEIAHALSIAPRNVLVRIEAALAALQAKLRDGVSGQVASLSPSRLEDAICRAVSVPPGLFEKVLARIARYECRRRVLSSPNT
jgi:hypothetical protein